MISCHDRREIKRYYYITDESDILPFWATRWLSFSFLCLFFFSLTFFLVRRTMASEYRVGLTSPFGRRSSWKRPLHLPTVGPRIIRTALPPVTRGGISRGERRCSWTRTGNKRKRWSTGTTAQRKSSKQVRNPDNTKQNKKKKMLIQGHTYLDMDVAES